jgi:hypothetical protein
MENQMNEQKNDGGPNWKRIIARVIFFGTIGTLIVAVLAFLIGMLYYGWPQTTYMFCGVALIIAAIWIFNWASDNI